MDRINADKLLELTDYDHKRLGVMLGLLDASGQAELVNEILEGLTNGADVRHWYWQAQIALGLAPAPEPVKAPTILGSEKHRITYRKVPLP